MRVAEERDILAIVEMARQVHEGSIFNAIAPFVPEDARQSFTAMLGQPHHSILVEGDPPIAVFAVRFQRLTANHQCWTAMELFWFVQPDERGKGLRFIRDVEAWVKEQGAYVFDLSVATGLDPRVMKLYDRMKYVPSEIHFSKVL